MAGELVTQVMRLKCGEEVITTVRQAVSGIDEANRKLQVLAEHWQIVGEPIYKSKDREYKLALP